MVTNLLRDSLHDNIYLTVKVVGWYRRPRWDQVWYLRLSRAAAHCHQCLVEAVIRAHCHLWIQPRLLEGEPRGRSMIFSQQQLRSNELKTSSMRLSRTLILWSGPKIFHPARRDRLYRELLRSISSRDHRSSILHCIKTHWIVATIN